MNVKKYLPGRALILLLAIVLLAACDPATSPGQDVVSHCSPASLPTISSRLPLGNLSMYSGSSFGNLYAFNPVNGTIRWCNHIALLPQQIPTVPPGIPSPPPQEAVSMPAVVNGVVYVCSDNGYTYAFNASDGTLRWSRQTGTSAVIQPVVVNGVLYVGNQNGTTYKGGPKGTTYALNASDGAVRWEVSGSGLGAVVLAANGTVYGTAGGNILYALNASDGSRRWQFQIGSGSLDAAPAVANGVVYIGSGDGDNHLYALNTNTGSVLWSYQAGPIQSSPVVSNGVVYFTAGDSSLYAMSASDGTLLWRYKVGEMYPDMPVFANGVVYLAADGLYALDAHSGKLLWHSPLGFTLATSLLPPTVMNAGLFVQVETENETIYLLNSQDGAVLAQMSIADAHYSPPITSVVLAP
jgi:outer membrane protein assembly factor BamB